MARKPGSLSQDTLRIIEQSRFVLKDEHPMTLRQLFYRLVSIQVLENTQAHYQKLSRVLTKGREMRFIPFEWMTDRSRAQYKPSMWENPKEFIKIVKESYRKDYWELQPTHVEVWSEKDAIVGTIQETTDHYGVIIRANRGFTSTTKVHEIAEYFRKLSDKSINVFYLGDHDPSGITIQEELYSRLKEYGTPYFEMTRLAIHKADIELFNLPPLRIKDSDTRAKKFRQNYGEDCVELDALPPNELRNRIENAIRGCIEFESWNRAEKAEQVELDSIVEICELFPK